MRTMIVIDEERATGGLEGCNDARRVTQGELPTINGGKVRPRGEELDGGGGLAVELVDCDTRKPR